MKITVLIFSVLFTNLMFGQNNTVLTINNSNYNVSEFNYIYTKNNPNASYHDDSLMAYIEKYFIDYKLKIIEAKRLGYDTLPRLINELQQYRTQLSRPYLIDKDKNEALVKEAYDRTINEVRASHILIKLAARSTPVDTLKAYNRAIELRKRILAGEAFEAVAAGPGGSDDKSVVNNKGDLGYFTALQMVYPFEEAAYNTAIGDVSMPVRTQFGYHIIKVIDKRKATGKIQTAHIMILSDGSKEQNEKGKAKIDEIYGLLQKGGEFKDLAQKYSDDQSSNTKGGVLPEFGAGTRQRMVPEFEKVAFSLTKDGAYSKPFQTAYGWHIVKRISLTPVPTYDQINRELKLKVEKDVRAQKTQQSFINKLKVDYKFSENKSLLEPLKLIMNHTVFSGGWAYVNDSLKQQNETIVSFANETFTLLDFIKYVEGQQRKESPQSMSTYIDYKYDAWINMLMLQYEDTQLEEKHPAFKNLMQEYEEGVLIFEIMQKQIWTKASTDSVGLREYYEAHKNEFTFEKRYDGELYKCKDKATAKMVLKMLNSTDLTNQQIKDTLNRDSQLNVNIKTTIFNATAKEFEIKSGGFESFETGKSTLYIKDGEYYVFKNKMTLKPSIRKFEEAKGLATAGYQNELHEVWLKELRSKADIKVNKEVLYKAESYK